MLFRDSFEDAAVMAEEMSRIKIASKEKKAKLAAEGGSTTSSSNNHRRGPVRALARVASWKSSKRPSRPSSTTLSTSGSSRNYDPLNKRKQFAKTYSMSAVDEMSVTSATSVSTLHNSSRSITSYGSSAGDSLHYHDCMSIDASWQAVRTSEGFNSKDLGEQIILKMLELDPKARQEMGIQSFRSQRFEELADILVDVVDTLITFLGPEIEEFSQELEEIGERCLRQGIQPKLLGSSVAAGVEHTLGAEKVSSRTREAWVSTFEYIAMYMDPSPP